MRTIADELANHPFFAGLRPDDLAFIAGCGQHQHFKSGQVLAREDDDADQFFVIRHGVVSVGLHLPTGGIRPLQTLEDGDIVGWSWLFPPYQWQFDVTASSDTRVIALNALCLRDKCEQDPRLGYDLMRRFAKVMVARLGAVRLQLLDVYNTADTLGAP